MEGELLAEPERRGLRDPALHALEELRVLPRGVALDVGPRRLAIGEFLRAKDVGEGGVHGVIHPRELRKRLRARPGLAGQQPRLREGAVDPVADRHDLVERLAVHHQHRYLAVRIHRQVLRRLVLALVQLDELRLELLAGGCLDRLERDVRHEGAGAGREVELDLHANAVGCLAVFWILCCPEKAR